MALTATEVLPVRSARGGVDGLVTAQGLMRLYHATSPTALLVARAGRDAAQADPGAFVAVHLGPRSPAVGRSLAELSLPAGAVLVSVERDGATFAPHGASVLTRGDRVLAYVSPAGAAPLVRAALEGAR
jgi:Trk K+ transport system NAD-binding subunit